MPAQHSVRAHQQPCPAQHTAREPVQQRGQEHPVTRGEPHPIPAEPAFQHRDLMTQREDLRVLVLVAHRQQPQQGEHVRHTQTGKSKQHDR
ncbi:hypothetical protein ACM01_10990 [Streptomyces viridochromogenes]|uniref:Uncharacterized protein n=1 Tax=Streptomyces viridochromogenes TaxID=1938 RepID=A0A0J7ZGH1_STRVR|nr:hypothetical protein ACM01_10990 [Streptomyces viridochromogenes]